MEWRFGIARTREGARDLKGPFEALCEAATALGGTRFRPHFAATYGDLVRGLDDGEIGLAWLPPIPALEAMDRHLASPLVVPARDGTTSYLSALVVRERGPKALLELRGRRVAWVDRESAAGYLVPRMHVAAEGFDVTRFFSRELFVGGHAGVVDAVVSGEVDVGATFCRVGRDGRPVAGPWMDDAGKSVRPVEVLSTVGPIPNDALFVSPDVPAGARTAIVRWLLAPAGEAPGRTLWSKVLDAEDFRIPAPDHFDALRHLLRAARARGASGAR